MDTDDYPHKQGDAALALLQRIRFHAQRHALPREWLTAADEVLGTWVEFRTDHPECAPAPVAQPLTDEQIRGIAEDFASSFMHGGTQFDEFNSTGFARAVISEFCRLNGIEGPAVRAKLLQSHAAMRARLEHVRASEATLIDQREILLARVQELELYAVGLEKESERVARELEEECDSLRASVGCSEALRERLSLAETALERERHARKLAQTEREKSIEERNRAGLDARRELAEFVEELKADRADAINQHAAALDLVSRIRWALGDNGARMQDELIEWCKHISTGAANAPLTGEAERLRAALQQVAQSHAWLAFGECRSFGADVVLLSPSDADAAARVALAVTERLPGELPAHPR